MHPKKVHSYTRNIKTIEKNKRIEKDENDVTEWLPRYSLSSSNWRAEILPLDLAGTKNLVDNVIYSLFSEIALK